MRGFLLFIFLSATVGCTTFYQPDSAQINGMYFEQIKDWQMRMKKEGRWTNSLPIT